MQQQKMKIAQMYERKEKQVEIQRKIEYSNALNKARLQVLRVQDDQLKVCV